jgi:hypothetical protein
MSFGYCDSINQIYRLRTYEQAESHYNRAKPLRGNGMKPNERPLHPKRGGVYKKYRVAKVEAHGHEAYDLIFHDTPVIRLFKPNPDGTRHVSIRGWHSQSTRAFMSVHGWGSSTMRTTDGQYVYVWYPHHIGSDYPSAFFTLDAANQMILNRSWNAPLCKYFSSADDKQRRKDFKRALETLFDMLYVQEFSIRENARTNRIHGSEPAAFRDVGVYVNAVIANPDTEEMLRPETLETMQEMASAELWYRARNEAYREAGELYVDDYKTNTWRYSERQDHAAKRMPELVQTMDMKPIITAVRDKFLDGCGFMNKNEKSPLIMFPTERPKGEIFHDRGAEHMREDDLLQMYKQV